MRKHRHAPIRQLRPVLHIFCEGEATEPGYIDGYKDLFCDAKASIAVEKTAKTTPVQLVGEAIKRKKSDLSGEGDEFWVVYDRESPIKYPEKLHQQARDKAAANNIHIALSNVCFEVWLLLHFQPTCAACNSCAELIARKDFKAHFPNYSKGTKLSFSKEQIAKARVNAERLNKCTIDAANPAWTVPSKWNPYTDVCKLLDAIDAFQRKILDMDDGV